MKNIHLIPTDKPSRLIKDFNSKLLVNYNNVQFLRDGYEFQNIYITSDDKFIKDEYITDGNEVIKTTPKLVNAQGLVDRRDWKKIILTTDELYIHNDLIPKEYNPFPQYIQKIDDEFLEWFVKNSSCEEVEVVIMNEGYDKSEDVPYQECYKIIIPKEEIKQETGKEFYEFSKEFYESADKVITVKRQETLEEAGAIAAGLCEHLEAKEQAMFIAGFQECAKWQAERMYSQGEVLAFGKSCFYKGFEKSEMGDANCYTAFREEIGFLFEQFKKK